MTLSGQALREGTEAQRHKGTKYWIPGQARNDMLLDSPGFRVDTLDSGSIPLDSWSGPGMTQWGEGTEAQRHKGTEGRHRVHKGTKAQRKRGAS